MKTLQTKLLIGLVPTLAILVALGLWAIVMFYRLGGNIDVILRENYRSILAAEGMKEAIERMDSGLLFAVGGRDERGREQFDANRPRFEEQPGDRAREHHRARGTGAGRRARSSLFRQLPGARPSGSLHCRSSRRSAGAEVYFDELLADLRRDPASGRPDPGPEPGQHDGDGSPRARPTPATRSG